MLGPQTKPCIAIACGGTGGHLFPGLAVAGQLVQRHLPVTLLVSPKEVDQRAARAALGMAGVEVVTLPAAAFQTGSRLAFVRGLIGSYRLVSAVFRKSPPAAVLAMGGFTSVAPVLAGKHAHARTFLHESNVVPGRANQLIARFADEAFLGFAETAHQLHCRKATVTGTPVRPEIGRRDPIECRVALGLKPDKPTVLVMGGSQGAVAINDLITAVLSGLGNEFLDVQWIHITGQKDVEKVKAAYARAGADSVVLGFCDKMHLALSAATMAVSRAGASALAELAAVQLPAILIPYPNATKNHQLLNARVFERAGAAIVVEQHSASPALIKQMILELIKNSEQRKKMQSALVQLHRPNAARDIADAITDAVTAKVQVMRECTMPTSAPLDRNLSVVP